jgi:hypothetical protein
MLAQHNGTRSGEPWYRTAVLPLRAPGPLEIEQIQSGLCQIPHSQIRILFQQKSEPACKSSRHDLGRCLHRTAQRARIFPIY